MYLNNAFSRWSSEIPAVGKIVFALIMSATRSTLSRCVRVKPAHRAFLYSAGLLFRDIGEGSIPSCFRVKLLFVGSIFEYHEFARFFIVRIGLVLGQGVHGDIVNLDIFL